MRTPGTIAAAVGLTAALALVGLALLAPLEVRHSAPFGFVLTLDGDRGIAVRGGFVTPNYPDFNRVDLDLRAYHPEADYDLTVHIRRDRAAAADLRTIPLAVAGSQIRHDKGAFADPFVTVRFPPIAESAGRRYYVRVEVGPRNRDDVVSLWSIKSYSRARGAEVLAAFLHQRPGDGAPTLVKWTLVGLLLALVGAFGWLVAAVTALAGGTNADRSRRPVSPVAGVANRWYTLSPLPRRAPPRASFSGTRRPPRARPLPSTDDPAATGEERD